MDYQGKPYKPIVRCWKHGNRTEVTITLYQASDGSLAVLEEIEEDGFWGNELPKETNISDYPGTAEDFISQAQKGSYNGHPLNGYRVLD